MAITFGSRFVSALLYGRVQKLNHEIDALYATGAGEEYLSRLVRASEKSEAHTAQLKQALMDELRTILTNLTERQIAAQAESHRALGAHFSQSIRTSLEEPLRDMTKAMQSVNQGAGEAAGTMLQSLLTGFMAKLEETFGGQMRGINEQMERSIAAMSTVQVALHKLVEDIGHSNERSSGAMRDTLEQTVGKVMGQLTLALDHMEATRIAATAQEQSRNEQLTSAAAQLVASLSTQVDGLVRSVGAVGTSSLVAMDGMTAGAREISEAAARIAAAGNAVSSLFDKTAVAGERLAATANALQTTSQAVRQGFEQYDRTRQTVDAHVTVLTELIATAHRDAGLSRQMLQELERLVGQIRVATHESEEYLKGINASLTTAFESFGNSLVGVIQKTSGETDKHLSNGMQHLIGVVQELAVALSRVKKM
jgi:predicted nucleic acid-binding protein